MFWLRMLLVLALLSPTVGWCLEPEEDGIKELIRDLKDPDPAVREDAVVLLDKTGPEAHAALILALGDDYADVRASALESLVKLGIDQPGVRDALENAQLDPHPYIKLLATETLEKK